MRRDLSCPTIVGRAADLGRLRDAWSRAETGEPSAVLVTGEAGIGKTRHLAAVGAELDPARWVGGGCVPLADGSVPYAPVVDLLRELSHRIGSAALEDLAGPDGAILLGLLPDAPAKRPATQPDPPEKRLAPQPDPPE